jgi:hypothetical protein
MPSSSEGAGFPIVWLIVGVDLPQITFVIQLGAGKLPLKSSEKIVVELVTANVTVADWLGSARLVAVTVTEKGLEEMIVGARYTTVFSPVIVPTLLFPLGMSLTNQATPVFEVPVTVAVNCCAAPTGTLDIVGESETRTPERIATVIAADLDASATLATWIVMVPGLGTNKGAV